MILDALTLLSDAQAVTATAFSTNTYDAGNVTPKNDIGPGEALAMLITVDVAADATTGDETYQFDIVTSANANLSSPTVVASRLIGRALLTAGRIIVFPIPMVESPLRYWGLQYTVGGTTPTITVTAGIVPLSFADQIKIYARGYVIS